MEFEYKIRFERNERSYRLIHFNSPWKNERELEEIRIMFDGKDLQDNDFSLYKVIKWETLEHNTTHDAVVNMKLYRSKDDGPYEQIFHLKSLEKIET